MLGLAPRLALASFLALAAAPLSALSSAAADSGSSKDRWLHVAVDGTPEDPERVRIHLPMRLAAALSPIVAKYATGDGDFVCNLNGATFDREDLLEVLDAVDDVKDGEFIMVDDATDHVRVSKEKGDIVIHVTERGKDSGERVDVRMPIVVARALTAGKGDDLDFAAALEALSNVESTELVSVHDNGERVRIWIDTKNTSD
jgi:hypothetical protein